MITKISRKLAMVSILMLTLLPVFGLSLTAQATNNIPAASGSDTLFWGGYETNVDENIGLGNTDPRVMASSVVRVILGFLGIIAVLLILLGGFKWMTAGGNEDGIAEAKKLLAAGVIGLIIILMAFGMAQFVINALYTATGAGE